MNNLLINSVDKISQEFDRWCYLCNYFLKLNFEHQNRILWKTYIFFGNLFVYESIYLNKCLLGDTITTTAFVVLCKIKLKQEFCLCQPIQTKV